MINNEIHEIHEKGMDAGWKVAQASCLCSEWGDFDLHFSFEWFECLKIDIVGAVAMKKRD